MIVRVSKRLELAVDALQARQCEHRAPGPCGHRHVTTCAAPRAHPL